jgi:hypothetical protein
VCNIFQLNHSPSFSTFQEHRSVAGMDIFNLHVLKDSLGFTYLQRTMLSLGIVWCLPLLCICRSVTSDLYSMLDSEEYIYKIVLICWRREVRLEAWKQWRPSYETVLTSSRIRVWIAIDMDFFFRSICALLYDVISILCLSRLPFLDMLLYYCIILLFSISLNV